VTEKGRCSFAEENAAGAEEGSSRKLKRPLSELNRRESFGYGV